MSRVSACNLSVNLLDQRNVTVLSIKRVAPLAAAFLAFVTSVATAATILDHLDPQDYRDLAADYPMVGRVSGSGYSGSGVLISDRWVLTAGHVADFKTNGAFVVGGVSYTIQSVISHPSHSLFTTTYDVGLLYLAAPVVGIEAATLVRFSSAESVVGREAVWVGLGMTGNGLTGAQSPSETRAFTNVIDGLTPYAGLPAPSFFADFDSTDGSGNSLAGLSSGATPTALEGNLAPGDSGGGVFVNVNGKNHLVGISSYAGGFSPGMNSKYGALSGAADLYQFHQWIYDQTGIAAVPELSACWHLVLASCWIMRRPRRVPRRENPRS